MAKNVKNVMPRADGQELTAKIATPKGSYFIHGFKNWKKSNSIGNFPPEICVSLQKDGNTNPLRNYGFILDIDKGGVINGYDRDVASKHLGGSKIIDQKSPANLRNLREYKEDELESLVENTRTGTHNEIWINSEFAEITKAYIVEKLSAIGYRPSENGIKSFLKACEKENLEIYRIAV